jgi:hypothetical protein
MSASAQLKLKAFNVANIETSEPRGEPITKPVRRIVVEAEKPENMPWPKLRHFFTYCNADDRQATAVALLKNPKGAHALADLHRAKLIDLGSFFPSADGTLTALQWYCQVIPVVENWNLDLGDFPSDLALYPYHLSIIRSLLSAGLSINAQGHGEPSPLEMALLSGASSALVSALLACGANPVEACRDPLRSLGFSQRHSLAPSENTCLSLAYYIAPVEVTQIITQSALSHLHAGVYEKQKVLNALVQVTFSEGLLELFKQIFLSSSSFRLKALVKQCCLANAGLASPEFMSELINQGCALKADFVVGSVAISHFGFWQKRRYFSLLCDLASAVEKTTDSQRSSIQAC